MDLDFKVNQDKYDPTDWVKLWILTQNDWGGIDFSNGKRTKKKGHVDAVIFHIHGGGFIMGSSGASRYHTFKYVRETGYPVFSVDYRLAPENKYPIPISDCW